MQKVSFKVIFGTKILNFLLKLTKNSHLTLTITLFFTLFLTFSSPFSPKTPPLSPLVAISPLLRLTPAAACIICTTPDKDLGSRANRPPPCASRARSGKATRHTGKGATRCFQRFQGAKFRLSRAYIIIMKENRRAAASPDSLNRIAPISPQISPQRLAVPLFALCY